MARNNAAYSLQTVVLGIVVILVCLGIAKVAGAADLNVSWEHPTQNTDGSAIPASGPGSLTETRIEYGQCNGTSWGTKTGEAIVPHPGTTTVIPNVGPGTWCVRGFSRNTYGSESNPSGVVSKVVPPPTPNPPTLQTIESVVYEIKLHPVTQVASLGRKVGVIAYGVPCGDAVMVGPDYYAVPEDKVSFSKPPRSSVVIARCALL